MKWTDVLNPKMLRNSRNRKSFAACSDIGSSSQSIMRENIQKRFDTMLEIKVYLHMLNTFKIKLTHIDQISIH